jgi:hypothetical protein
MTGIIGLSPHDHRPRASRHSRLREPIGVERLETRLLMAGDSRDANPGVTLISPRPYPASGAALTAGQTALGAVPAPFAAPGATGGESPGALHPADRIDILRLRLDDHPRSLRLDLTELSLARGWSGTIWVVREDGRVLLERPLDAPFGRITLDLSGSRPSGRSQMEVAVVIRSPLGAGRGAEGFAYRLRVTLVGNSTLSTTMAGGTASGGDTAFSYGGKPSASTGNHGPSPAGPSRPDTVTGTGPLIGAAPLPASAHEPAGGVLSDGGPTASPHFVEVPHVNMMLLRRLPQRPQGVSVGPASTGVAATRWIVRTGGNAAPVGSGTAPTDQAPRGAGDVVFHQGDDPDEASGSRASRARALVPAPEGWGGLEDGSPWLTGATLPPIAVAGPLPPGHGVVSEAGTAPAAAHASAFLLGLDGASHLVVGLIVPDIEAGFRRAAARRASVRRASSRLPQGGAAAGPR